MSTAILSASRRTDTGKGVARALRRDGQVPAVIYGHKREPQSLSVPTREVERLLERISAGTTVVELNIDGSVSRTLIREIQKHPFKKHLIHIDFQELVAGEKITVEVPLKYVGTSIGVRQHQGILDQIMQSISVSVDPAQMPNHIDVDISTLDVGQSIHVSDLKIPAGVTVLANAGDTVAIVQAPKVEAAPAGEPGAGEPEVIRAKKPADDETK
jgi:large subunit ribosomal protein L25